MIEMDTFAQKMGTKESAAQEEETRCLMDHKSRFVVGFFQALKTLRSRLFDIDVSGKDETLTYPLVGYCKSMHQCICRPNTDPNCLQDISESRTRVASQKEDDV